MGKKVAKFVGIGMLCVVAVLGIGIGIFALTGGFDQTVIALTALYFDEQVVETEGYVMNIQDVRTEDEAALSTKKYIVISDDYTMAVGCLPADATNKTLEVTTSQVTAAIEVPKTIRAGEKFTIKVKKDANGKNIGGSAKITFKSESGVSCDLYVIVDIVLEDADIKLDVSGFSSISPSTATGSSLGGNNRYVLARKSGSANLTLESSLANTFKINQSGITNKDFKDNSIVKFFDKKVYVFADQEDVVSIEKNKTAPVTYDITLNLEQVQGSNLTLFVRTHRTYEMQQEFEELGLDVFMDYYQEGLFEPDKIENTFNNQNFALNYVELIAKYSGFVNKYYDYIVKDRNESAFFEQLKNASGKIAFSESGDLFKTQVWESLKFVFVNADIDLFISDIDIKTMQVLADSPYIMEVFENKSISLEELISIFEINLENDDPTVVVEEADKIALLSNMAVGIYVDDKTKVEKDNETLENDLKELYNVGTLQNGNGLTFDSDRAIKVADLHRNNSFVALSRIGDSFTLDAQVPSKYVHDGNFQIYIVFSIAITKSTGVTSIFYDFGKIDITYEEEISYEGGMPHSNILYINEMCVNNNNAIPEDTSLVSGAIGSQTIEINMNRILGANSKYAVPKFFIEKSSNEYSYEGEREYLEITETGNEKRIVGQDGSDSVVYNLLRTEKNNGQEIEKFPIREFISMEGDSDTKISYKDKPLQAYEVPVTHKFDMTGNEADRNIYTVDIEAINALANGSVKIFWACVLVDKDSNPIDRDGNRLFNDDGKPIVNGDMGTLLNGNVSYVMLYSSLDESLADYFQNIGIKTISLLENLNFYSQNTSSAYIYKTKDGELKNVQNKEYFLRNHRDSVEEAYTRLRLISREVYDDALIVSGFNLATEVIEGSAKVYPCFTTEEIELAKSKGIDLYGNIYIAMEMALLEENFGFSTTNSNYVVANFNDNKLEPIDDPVDPNPGVEPEPEIPEVSDTTYWKIGLEAHNFDMSSPQTICSLSLNTNCELYEILNNSIVRIQVSAPKITNISVINHDTDDFTSGVKYVGLENFNKKIFIDGAFSASAQANAGDIDWGYTYSENGETKTTDYSFYSTGKYRVEFQISTEGSDMELLSAYYEREIARIITAIGEDISEEEKEDFTNTANPVFDRILGLVALVEKLNAGGRNIDTFNPKVDNNIVDIMTNNSNYIENYLNKLIRYDIEKVADLNVFKFVGDVDDALALVQNYGVFVNIPSDSTVSEKATKLKEALLELSNINPFINLEAGDIDSVEIENEETEEDNLKQIQEVMTKILTNQPKHDAEFVNIKTILKNAYKYDLKEVSDKFVKAYRLADDYFDECDSSSKIIQKIMNSEKIVDKNYNREIELTEIIEQLNAQIRIYNDTVSSLDALSEISYSIITQNLEGYFEDGKLLNGNEIVLNDNGTLPLKTGFRDNLVFNVELFFGFYPYKQGAETVNYRYEVKKEYSFYMNFKPVGLTVESFDLSEPITAGSTMELGSKIKLTGMSNMNHVTLTIPNEFRSFLYFTDGENRLYSIKASANPTLHIDNLINEDKVINILVSIPYYDANGVQLTGRIEAMIKHNIDVSFADTKFVSSASKVSSSEVLETDATGYYDLKNFVLIKDSDGSVSTKLRAEISEISDGSGTFGGRVSLIGNELKIAAFNIAGESITLNIRLYDSLDNKLVATYSKTIEINPYYRVVIDTFNNTNQNFGGNGTTYYLNQVLDNHFNAYDLDLIKVDVINTEDYSYRRLDITKADDRVLIESVLKFSGVHNGENDSIEKLQDTVVLGTNIRNQFYQYNQLTTNYEQTYLGSDLKNWVSANGDIDLPELANSVIVPIKMNISGYMNNLKDSCIYFKVGGIRKLVEKEGLGNPDDINSYKETSFADGTNGFKQQFEVLSLNAGATYNLDEYIQLVLKETNPGEEFSILKVSYVLETNVAGVEFKEEENQSSIIVDEDEVKVNGNISIGDSVENGAEIVLQLKVYRIVEAGANIVAEEIEYSDTLTIKVVNEPASE